MEENKILDSGHYDCTCTQPEPYDIFPNVKICLNCKKPLPNQFPELSIGAKSVMEELKFFTNQYNCEHEYIVQDQDWKTCTKCGNIKPTRDCRLFKPLTK